MKPSHAGIVALGWLVAWSAIWAQNPKAPPKNDSRGEPVKLDFSQPETAKRPLPKWIKGDAAGKQVFIDQGKFDPRLKGYLTPEGVKVEIVAEQPAVINPVAMAFGDDGTLFVIEWRQGDKPPMEVAETFTYKDGTPRKIATMKKPIKDVVKALRDPKNAGVFNESKVVLEDDLPSGILLHDGWLYLSGRGTVRRTKLADVLERTADKPQPKTEVIAQGFGGLGERQVSGMTIGNDGWLYTTVGAGNHYVEGSDGSRATVLRTGAVFRCRPDGTKLHTYSIGYANPYRDIAFDAGFNAFHADNDHGGGRFAGCRIMHVVEESDFGWRGTGSGSDLKVDTFRAWVGGELPGRMSPMAKTGRGAASGLLIYNETRFPNHYRGLLFYPDVGRQSIRAYRVIPNGSTFETGVEFEFLKSADPLFRPCQMIVGPDGAIYVCDWRTNSSGAGELAGDGKNGRIYRITWAGNDDAPAIARRQMNSWARFAGMMPPALIEALSSPDFTDRLKAQQQLVKKGAAVRNDLLDVLGDSKATTPARIAALGALHSLWNDDVKEEFLAQLYAGDPDIRRLAADGLSLFGKPGDNDLDAALLQRMGDQEHAPRRAIILAMGRIGGVSAPDALANTLRSFKEDDAVLYDGIIRATERLGKPGIEKLVGMALSGVDKDFERSVEAFRMLRTRPGADAIPDLLNYPHLTIPQRVNLIKAYNNYQFDPPVALAPLLKWLDVHKDEPAQVKLAALEVLAMPDAPRSDRTEELALALLEPKDSAFRIEVVEMIEAGRLTKCSGKLIEILGDPARPAAERASLIRALRVLGDKAALPLLKDVLAGKSGDESLVKAQALQTLAALDPAAGQDSAKPLLESKDAVMQHAAVVALLTQPAGAKLVGEQFLAGNLPRELRREIVKGLRQHAAQADIAKLLTEVMKSEKE